MVGPGNHEVETLIDSRTVYVNHESAPTAAAAARRGDEGTRRRKGGRGQGTGTHQGKNSDSGDDDDDGSGASGGIGSSGDTNILVPGPAKMFVAFESRYRMPAVRPAQYGQITYSPQSGGRPWQPTAAQPDPPCGDSVFQVRPI